MSLTATTLSAAVPASGANSTLIIPASVTGFNNPQFNQGAIPGSGGLPPYNVVQVDMELMKVLSVNTTTLQVFVERGYEGTAQVAHASGAPVFVGLPNDFQSTGPSNFQAGKVSVPIQLTEGPTNQQAQFLSGSADAINAAVPGFYVVKTAGVDAMTLAAPPTGAEGNIVEVWSDTTNAHTITATSLFANGTALKTTATYAAFRGAGVRLRAVNGVWHVLASTAVTFT